MCPVEVYRPSADIPHRRHARLDAGERLARSRAALSGSGRCRHARGPGRRQCPRPGARARLASPVDARQRFDPPDRNGPRLVKIRPPGHVRPSRG